MLMAHSEKRVAKRVLYQCTILFRSEKTIVETTLDISNISMSGVYVVTTPPLDVDTKCSIEIRFRDQRDNPDILLAEGVVARCDNRGQGIEFTNLDEEAIEKLYQIVSLSDN
jgi:c-di-GMP-binding flagellar brake protein YcgR